MVSITDHIIEVISKTPRDPIEGHVAVFLQDCLEASDMEELSSFRAGLDRIAARIHVARKIHTDYGPEWSEKTGSVVLPMVWWPVLICVLLKAAERLSDRGMAAKCLNAAFAALDLYVDQGGIEFRDMLSEAGDNLMRQIAVSQ